MRFFLLGAAVFRDHGSPHRGPSWLQTFLYVDVEPTFPRLDTGRGAAGVMSVLVVSSLILTWLPLRPRYFSKRTELIEMTVWHLAH